MRGHSRVAGATVPRRGVVADGSPAAAGRESGVSSLGGGADRESALWVYMRPKSHAHRNLTDSESRNRTVAAIAAPQFGSTSHRQLIDAGVSHETIKRWLRSGRLIQIFSGVYLLGHEFPPLNALEVGAALACGRSALVGLTHAVGCWDLLPRPPRSQPINIIVPPDRIVRRKGIRSHRRTLHPAERGARNRLPLTSVTRTLFDIAPIVPTGDLELAFATAVGKGWTDVRRVTNLLARHPGERGTGALKRMLVSDPAFTRSRAERRLRALVLASGLPRPEVNVPIGPYRGP